MFTNVMGYYGILWDVMCVLIIYTFMMNFLLRLDVVDYRVSHFIQLINPVVFYLGPNKKHGKYKRNDRTKFTNY